jgi:hypothetical protein
MLAKMKNSDFLRWCALFMIIAGFFVERQGIFLGALVCICSSMILSEIEEGRKS